MRIFLLFASLGLAVTQANAQTVEQPYPQELDELHRLGAQCDSQKPAPSGCAQVYGDLTRFYGSLDAYSAAMRPMSDPELNVAHSLAASCDTKPPAASPCAITFARLGRHYGSYGAFLEADQAWKGKRGYTP